jgi:23S rRNA pseudouridine2605 synthase
MAEERLQKILSAAGVASRRASEQMILDGRVSVNNVTILTLGSKADPVRDDIRVDGSRVRPERIRYILLNKPEKVVTTRDDPQHRRTVMDLLRGVKESVYPVGRLDFDSAGLLLLTNDGDLAARLMHPRHGIEKVYRADVRGIPADSQLERLADGVEIDGQRTLPARVTVVKAIPSARGEGTSVLEIAIREGRNRQVRRMCDAVGHPVVRLTRIAIGPLRDRTLRPGEWRDLNAREIEVIKRAVADEAPADRRP